MSLRSRLDPVELPNREFRKLFRLTKDLYQNLVGELTPYVLHRDQHTYLCICEYMSLIHCKFSYPTSTRRHGNFAGVHTLLRILLSSNSAVLINIITGVSPPHFDFVVYYVLCQC
jgi:hypothetical protein